MLHSPIIFRFYGRPFVVLDTETTGFRSDDEVVQVSVVSHSGDVWLNTYVRPTKQMDAKAAEVNGISEDVLRCAPVFSEVFPEIRKAVEGRVVVAYNASFDSRMLQQTCTRYNLPVIKSEWACAMLAFCEASGNSKWAKLSEACETAGIEVVNAHDALGDVNMTLGLIHAMGAASSNAYIQSSVAEQEISREIISRRPEETPEVRFRDPFQSSRFGVISDSYRR